MLEWDGTDWFYDDIERLSRFSRLAAESVYDLIDYHLAEYGGVPDSCKPHILNQDRGCLSGYMECHVESDVLLVYRVVGRHVLLVRLCTHWELYKCAFDSRTWPDPADEAREKLEWNITDDQIHKKLFG